MATVQANMLKLHQRVNTFRKDTGAEFTLATVGTVDGQSFPKQEILDYYNHARLAFVEAMVQLFGPEDAAKLGGAMTVATNSADGNVAFTATGFGNYVGFARPTGFIKFKGLIDVASPPRPIYLVSEALRQASQAEYDSTQSATIRFVTENSGGFIHTAGEISAGTKASLSYMGVTDFVLSDVTGGSTTETINDRYQLKLVDLAAKIALSKGEIDAVGFAKTLITQVD